MRHIQLSDKVQLPIEAVTKKIGCVGMTGAGKTYLAGLIAEQMLDAIP